MTTQVSAAVAAIREHAAGVPDVALILGSGLGDLADELEHATSLSFRDIPGFPAAAVAGHAGRLVLGALEGASCAVLQGRFHLYEGHDAATVALPTRVLLGLGARTLIVTNAAGGINAAFRAGDLMLIEDHLNLMGTSPLTGPPVEGDTRFPDMTDAYDVGLRHVAQQVADDCGVELRKGVYAALAGPAYETPAEVRMLAGLGADAVGMSTVPEVIVARARSVPVLGLSLISNQAAGLSGAPLSHEEVMAAGVEARGRFGRLVRGVVRQMQDRST